MGEDDSHYRCPTCGEVIRDLDRLLRHLDGLDAKRLDCARQDIEAIKARRQDDEQSLRYTRW